MNEKPILFSTPMVQAILSGRKTQTRRVMKVQPLDWQYIHNFHDGTFAICGADFDGHPFTCPYGAIGDTLWVRETFHVHNNIQVIDTHTPFALIDGVKRAVDYKAEYPKASLKWKPSIFMPKTACRLRLKITDIRVERLQDISEDDAKAEGMQRADDWRLYPDEPASRYNHISHFELLWDSINGKKHPWSDNPWVWAITFEKENP